MTIILKAVKPYPTDSIVCYGGWGVMDSVPLWVVWWIALGILMLFIVFVLIRKVWAIWVVAVAELWILQSLVVGQTQQWMLWWAVSGTLGLLLWLVMRWRWQRQVRRQQREKGMTQRDGNGWQVFYNGRWYIVRNVASGQILPPLVKVVRIDGNVAEVEVEQ